MSTRTTSTVKSSHWTQPTNRTSESDRRRRQRMNSSALGYIVGDDYESSDKPVEPWEVRVHDVSRHGVGFTTSAQMKSGEICRIRIGHGPMRLARRMRVISCTPDGQNHFRVGAEFA